MTSKERVKAVLELKVPDKVPYGEFAFDFDTVARVIGHETYFRAKAKSQIGFWEGIRDELIQSWKEDAVEFFKKLDCVDMINDSAMASAVCPPRGISRKPLKSLTAIPGGMTKAGYTSFRILQRISQWLCY